MERRSTDYSFRIFTALGQVNASLAVLEGLSEAGLRTVA